MHQNLGKKTSFDFFGYFFDIVGDKRLRTFQEHIQPENTYQMRVKRNKLKEFEVYQFKIHRNYIIDSKTKFFLQLLAL